MAAGACAPNHCARPWQFPDDVFSRIVSLAMNGLLR
jgi:hypothetical protein